MNVSDLAQASHCILCFFNYARLGVTHRGRAGTPRNLSCVVKSSLSNCSRLLTNYGL